MGPTVLLVEDDATFSELVERHLRAHGYTVAVVGSVAEATRWLDTAADSPPGVVLLDINLPDASGWELIRSGVLTGPAPRRWWWSQLPPSALDACGNTALRAACPSRSRWRRCGRPSTD